MNHTRDAREVEVYSQKRNYFIRDHPELDRDRNMTVWLKIYHRLSILTLTLPDLPQKLI